MCISCGCAATDKVTISDPNGDEKRVDVSAVHEHDHAPGAAHTHAHEAMSVGESEIGLAMFRPVRAKGPLGFHLHAHAHGPGHHHSERHDYLHHHHHDEDRTEAAALHARQHGATVALDHDILAKNQHLAEHNRDWFVKRGILALNLVSSPGSGKTTLLERTIRDLGDQLPIEVVEGDQATLNDAERIRATGCKVIQINTGTGCHLDADMLARGLRQLDPGPGSVLMIENVGNLVCPALFDLGEQAKVVILSVTEGEDKPIKYPHMFRASKVMLLNKIDLLPHLRFDIGQCMAYARQVNPGIRIFSLSAETGAGMGAWYGWLREEAAALQQRNLAQ